MAGAHCLSPQDRPQPGQLGQWAPWAGPWPGLHPAPDLSTAPEGPGRSWSTEPARSVSPCVTALRMKTGVLGFIIEQHTHG